MKIPFLVHVKKMAVVIVIFVNLTQPSIKWDQSLSEVLSSLGWLIVILLKNVLIKLTYVVRNSSLDVAPFHRQGNLKCIWLEKYSWTQASEHKCIHFSLLLTMNVILEVVYSFCLNFPTVVDYNLILWDLLK